MNGEVTELCLLAAHAKYTLKHSGKLRYTPTKYIESQRFALLAGKRESTESSADKWFKKSLSRGLTDVFMLLPTNAEDINLHGFINTSDSSLLCFWESGEVTFLVPIWSFNKEKRLWRIEYTEHKWDNPPNGKPKFTDNTPEFHKALTEIAEFADKIDESHWANVFREADDILTEKTPIKTPELPDLPEKNLRLYAAAEKADVFGAMMSWNDSPPYSAHEKGLSEDYKRFSHELFIQIKKALLFAVNEI